jgi:hypothetical protein
MLEAALAHVAAGYKVFPCHSPVEGGCSCGEAECVTREKVGKHPRVKDWVNVATADPTRIRVWWRWWPDANIGVPTGEVNGIDVIDIDPRHGGDETWTRIIRGKTLPITTFVQTGGGGDHVYFTHTPGVTSGANVLGPGIDVRGDGGYVLGVGSLHASGQRYDHHVGSGIAEAPSWLMSAVRGSERAGRSVDRTRGGGGPRRPASHWRRLLEGVHDGEGRDEALTSVAGMLLHDPDIPPDQRLPLLKQFNEWHCVPPKSDRDIRRIAGVFRRYAR